MNRDEIASIKRAALDKVFSPNRMRMIGDSFGWLFTVEDVDMIYQECGLYSATGKIIEPPPYKTVTYIRKACSRARKPKDIATLLKLRSDLNKLKETKPVKAQLFLLNRQILKLRSAER